MTATLEPPAALELGRRRIMSSDRLDATMRNDFLTPRGTPYKWQEMRASLSRDVIGRAGHSLAPVAYTWADVASRTARRVDGATAGEPAWTAWTFARGQSFRAALKHCDVVDAAPDAPEVNGTVTEVSYPGLLRSPSVDLLLMLSWDVLMFETMCTHMATAEPLQQVGVPVDLARISNTWGHLVFSDPATRTTFHNAAMTVTRVGEGRHRDGPTAVFTYRCFDCELTTNAGPVTQVGRSSYLGTVEIDLATSDLVSGEMIEMIVATQVDAGGREVPVQRRRYVRVSRPGCAAPAPAASAAVPASTVDRPAPPAALLRAIAREADAVHDRLRAQVRSLDNLPAHVLPLAQMGFHSTVGTDGDSALSRLDGLRTDVRAWAAGDGSAADRVLAQTTPAVRMLEGMVAFSDVSAGEALRLGQLPVGQLLSLEHTMRAFKRELAALIRSLEKLDATVHRRRT